MGGQIEFARRLRRGQSNSEALLWSRLRAHRLSGWKFKRQVPFGTYIADFCCGDGRLVVELDGGSHTKAGQPERDAERTRFIQNFGYQVIRFWNDEVWTNLDGVCETILAELEKRR